MSIEAAARQAREREAFEDWASPEGFNIDRDYDDESGQYHRATTRWAWRAWQARAALAATAEPVAFDEAACRAQCAICGDDWPCAKARADEYLAREQPK